VRSFNINACTLLTYSHYSGVDLERYQLKLDAELALARTQEQEQRRNAQELEAVRTKFAAREAELEGDLRRIERENRQFKDDLRVYEDDLRRERESVRTLTVSVSLAGM